MLVSSEMEVVGGDVVFTPGTWMMLRVARPAETSETKALAVVMLGESVASGDVLNMRTVLAVPSPDGDGWPRRKVVPLTLLALVSASVSVWKIGKVELGLVFAVVSVCMEEVTVWSEAVPIRDVSPGPEVDNSRGGLVGIMLSPAGVPLGEEK